MQRETGLFQASLPSSLPALTAGLRLCHTLRHPIT